jgi:hypothetical protein
MSHKPRPWPNVAKEARDRAAEEAVAGILALEPVVRGDRSFSETDRLRREAQALNALQRVARILESVGAQTRPF